MQAGNPGAMSVIPSHAKLVGTVRTFRPATQDMIERRLAELVPSIAAAFGAMATLKYERVYPATINHDREAELRRRRSPRRSSAARTSSATSTRRWGRRTSRSCCRRSPAPSRGWGRAAPRAAASCTTARYDFNDEVIPLGAGYLAALAEAAMPLARLMPDARDAGFRAMDPVPQFSRTYAEARAKFLARRAGPRSSRSNRTGCPVTAAPTARRWRWTSRCSERREATASCVLTSATHGIEGYCGSGVQVGLLHDDGFVAGRARRARCRAVRSRGQSVRLFARPARQRGQRRPQPELPRLRDAGARQRAHTPTSIRCCCRRRGRLRRENEAAIGGIRRRARPACVPGGGLGRPVRVSGRPLFRGARVRPGATRPARGAAAPRVGAPARWAGSISTRGSAPAATARRSTPDATSHAELARARAWWGRRGYFRSTTAHRRRRWSPASVLRRRLRRMPGGRVHRDRARIRHGAAGRGVPGAARRPLAAQSSARPRRRCGRRSAASARRVLRRSRRLEGAGLRAGARAQRSRHWRIWKAVAMSRSRRAARLPTGARCVAVRGNTARAEAVHRTMTEPTAVAVPCGRRDPPDASPPSWAGDVGIQLPPLAGGDRVGDRPCRLPRGRAVRAVGRAAQPVRPQDAEPARRADAARPGCAGRQGGLPRSAPTTRAATCSRRSCSARASRCWSASRRSALAIVVGVSLGLVAGYVGGKVDAFIMRVADVQLSFPAILIALLIDGVARAVLPRDAHSSVALFVLVLAIGAANWVQYARTVRGSTMVEKSKEYVQAARVIGISPLAHHAPAPAAERPGPGAGARDDQHRHRDHHRGDAVVPRRGRAADAAVARHADPRRQRFPVLRASGGSRSSRAPRW